RMRLDPPGTVAEPVRAAVQVVAAFVGVERVPPAREFEGGAGDAVAVAADELAEEGGVATVGARVAQAEDHVDRPVRTAHAQPGEDPAQVEDLGRQLRRIPDRMRIDRATVVEPPEPTDPAHASSRNPRRAAA